MKNWWVLFSIFPVAAFCIGEDDDIFEFDQEEDSLILISYDEVEKNKSDEFDYEELLSFNTEDALDEEPMLSWEAEDFEEARISNVGVSKKSDKKKNALKPEMSKNIKEEASAANRPDRFNKKKPVKQKKEVVSNDLN